MVLPFWVLYCTQEQGLSPSQAGLLLAIYGVGAIAGAYLGGMLSNRIGPLKVLAGSMALTSAGLLLLMNAESWNSMIACLLFLSVSAESCRPASASATAAFCSTDQHSRAYALNRLAVNLGMAIGPTVGGFLAETNFRLLFIVDAATCSAATVLATVLVFSKTMQIQPASEATTLRLASGPWRDKPFLTLIGLEFFVALAFFQVMGTYPLYLRDHYGMTESRIGMLFAVNTVVIVFTEMWLIQSVQHLSKLRVIAYGSLLACAGFGLIAFGNTFYFAVVSVLVWTLGEMLSAPVAMSYVSARANEANRGTYLGIYTMTFSAASVVAPLLGTWLYERNPMWVWHGCLLIGLITFAGFSTMSRRAPKQQPEQSTDDEFVTV